jgi:dephospho-CoA kinase
MLIVGLTGGIASGKSTVSEMFRESGVPVICLDELAHTVVEPGRPALEDIRRIFGEEFITPEGGLDREVMAAAVFRNQGKRKQLEAITHPRIDEEVQNRVAEFERQGHFMVVQDVPLLYEIQYERRCDCVVVVYVPREVQKQRLISRDGMSPEDASSRLDAQMPIEEKRARADYLVDNSGDLESTREQVDRILEELRSEATKKASDESIRALG